MTQPSSDLMAVEARLFGAVIDICVAAGIDPVATTIWLCDGGLAEMFISHFSKEKPPAPTQENQHG